MTSSVSFFQYASWVLLSSDLFAKQVWTRAVQTAADWPESFERIAKYTADTNSSTANTKQKCPLVTGVAKSQNTTYN